MYLPIVFITDKNYLIQTATALESIKQNKCYETNIKVYLLTTKESTEQIKALKAIESESFLIELIIADDALINNLPGAQEKYVAASKAALLKFSIPNLIREEKIIYLDGDVIVKKDLSDLFSTNIDDVYAAVVPDLPQVLYAKPLFDEGNGRYYFNTGVMLLNLEKLRQDNVYNKLVEDKINHTTDLLMDQNSFNRVLGRNVNILPPIYNLTIASLIRSKSKYSIHDLNNQFRTNYKDLDEMRERAVIVHYSSKDKPWVFFDTPEADTWITYFAKSIYGNLSLIRRSKLDIGVDFKQIMLSNEADCIPVVLSTNDKYVPNLIVTIHSTSQSCTNKQVKFFILYSDLSEYNISLIKEKLPHENISLVNISNLLKENEKNLKTCGHFSAEMYYRWYIPEIFYEYNRVIYLDCDIVVRDDISKLFNENLNNKTFGAIINLQNKTKALDRFNKLKSDQEHYVNSGVLLIDNRKFIRNELKNKLFRFVRENPKIDCPDQDALNAVALNEIKKLNPLWNVQWHFQFISDKEKNNLCFDWSEYINNLKNAKIIHYTSNIKPWTNSNLPYANIFTEIFEKLGLNFHEKESLINNSEQNGDIWMIIKLFSNIFASDNRNKISLGQICPDFRTTDFRNRLFIYAIKQKDLNAARNILTDIASNDKKSIRKIYENKLEQLNKSLSMKLTFPFRGFKNPILVDVLSKDFGEPKIHSIGLNDNCCELLRILSKFFNVTKVWNKGTSEYLSDYPKFSLIQKEFVLSMRYGDITSAYILLQNIIGTNNHLVHSHYQEQIDAVYRLKSMIITRPLRTIVRILKK